MNQINEGAKVSIFKVVLSCFLCLGLGLGFGWGLAKVTGQWSYRGKGFESVGSSKDSVHSQSGFSSAVLKSRSAVVNVFSEKTVTRPSAINLFFGDIFDEAHGFAVPPLARKEKSLGSGVLISQDGYILTNNHVIKDSTEIKVALSNEKEYVAKLVGSDPKTDLALLKIEADGLNYLPFADSDRVQVGDIVLAIGNPFGIGQAVSMGIVSAKKRENLGLLDYEDFIQTDAAINPGNSGGALIDSEGNLIGINTALYSRSGGYQGISFAVPSNLAKKIADELRQKGKIERSHLGVSIVGLQETFNPLTAYLVEKGFREGALVVKVEPKSAADNSGIGVGTLITKINNRVISRPEQVFKIVAETPPNGTLDIEAQVVDMVNGHISKENFIVKPKP
jgi:serine protease Do